MSLERFYAQLHQLPLTYKVQHVFLADEVFLIWVNSPLPNDLSWWFKAGCPGSSTTSISYPFLAIWKLMKLRFKMQKVLKSLYRKKRKKLINANVIFLHLACDYSYFIEGIIVFIMIDQIKKLLKDGLKSSPETCYTENKWISRKNQNRLYFLHRIDIFNDLLLIHLYFRIPLTVPLS